MLVLAVAAVACGCGGGEPVSNTGYQGTWVRGGESVKSVIAIYREGDDYRFRLTKESDDGSLEVRCDWSGACEEIIDGDTRSRYTFTTWVDAETGHLMVDLVVEVMEPEPRQHHTLDELVVGPGGRRLWAHVVERDGRRFEGDARPKRSFRKVSDSVADPPVAAGS